ncbi:HlyD family efflux transporter periplasmic adaptor subunit [Thermoanaerobacterium sp. PSU-2]|uniref:HlyD family efflux transporter periplasmic adaptor subunit n=1 Tax=Thermoanaerobacterium sp. PSU-2 TaxID=1930849 RepID=UPI001F0A834B|nr:HlyD family efflux transporter periplasmic adaptor subunit [Thermoanaerobacterium sp. PSU-2]
MIQSINELTDSREILESRPYPVASITVYIFLSIIISALIWSYFSEKEIVVKANGVIRPYEYETNILNKVTGNVQEIYVKDGQVVKQGDILYTIDHKVLDLQKSILEDQLKKTENEVENLKKLKKSILDGKNYFDKNSEEEYYYYKYMAFYIDRKSIENQVYAVNIQSQDIKDTINNLKLLEQAINQNVNNLNSDSSYYNQFVDYQMNINQKQEKIQQLQTEQDREITNAERTIFDAQQDLQNYLNQYNLNLKTNIEQNKAQLDQLNGEYVQTKDLQNTINNLNLLIQSINDNKNYLPTNSLYYYQFLDYQMNVQQYQYKINQLQNAYNIISQNQDALPTQVDDARTALNAAQQDLEIYKNQYIMNIKANIEQNEEKINQLQGIQAEIQSVENTINNLKLLQKSINDNSNYLSPDSSYYNQFLDYQLNIKQRQDKINELQDNASQQADDEKNAINSAKEELLSYQNQYMLNLKANIEQNETKLKELQANTGSINVEKFTFDTISQIDDNIEADENEIQKLKGDINNINLNIEDYIVKAPTDGTVNMIMNINKGDLLQSGTETVKIIPDKPEYKVQLYISNKDIANIKVGQNIKYHVLALPYQEYGDLTGKITKVGLDSRTDQQSGINYYDAEATINNKTMYSHSGEKGSIKVGMIVEAQVVTRKEKMLYYILEQLNLWN